MNAVSLKRDLIAGILSVILAALCGCANVPQHAQAPAPAPAIPDQDAQQEPDVHWPVAFASAAGTFTVYEPQSDFWDGHQLNARSAIAFRHPGQSQSAFGVMTFSAITLVDKSAHTVTLAEIKVQSVNLPSSSGQGQDYLTALRQEFPVHASALSLVTLETSVSVADSPVKAERLNNTPPKIIIATRLAVLVYIDGPPAWRPVPGTSLQRVINTRAVLVRDQSGNCYLHLFDGYLTASSLDDPWKIATTPPAGVDVVEKLTDSGQVDLLEGEPDPKTHLMPSLKTSLAPEIHVATTPTELITFNGEPKYTPIAGTELVYVANTSANVFKLLSDQQFYVLLSGRWFRAPSLDGPWQFVPGGQLPRDFANIPDSSPKENVKASVPGTPQASEALIANSIPQSTAVSRTTQMPSPQIDGSMQLAPIEGTPLHYVVNSATPIIQVSADSWYACENGVWQMANSVNGPWIVATSIPPVIYTIPPNSPLHYLTYVQVYGSTPDVVYEGYTPGYMGAEVGYDDTVVYGTGYYYSPWVGSVWIGPPVTWGCGFAPCWTPWWGWGFDCGFGWWDCFPPFPWWGGFCDFDHHHHHDHDHGHDGHGWQSDHGHFASTGSDVYHRHDTVRGQGSLGRVSGTAFNNSPHREGLGDVGRSYNSRTGNLSGGQRSGVQNVGGAAWHSTSHSGGFFHSIGGEGGSHGGGESGGSHGGGGGGGGGGHSDSGGGGGGGHR